MQPRDTGWGTPVEMPSRWPDKSRVLYPAAMARPPPSGPRNLMVTWPHHEKISCLMASLQARVLQWKHSWGSPKLRGTSQPPPGPEAGENHWRSARSSKLAKGNYYGLPGGSGILCRLNGTPGILSFFLVSPLYFNHGKKYHLCTVYTHKKGRQCPSPRNPTLTAIIPQLLHISVVHSPHPECLKETNGSSPMAYIWYTHQLRPKKIPHEHLDAHPS